MKEVTYEEWQKNPTPRMMWVWNSNVENKVQAKVIYVIKSDAYSVITLTDNDVDLLRYKHCAEIEEPKTRRMTNKELSWWLSEKPHRERKFARAPYIYTYYTYCENEQDKEIPDNILIREDDGKWREPLVGQKNDGERKMGIFS